MYKAIIVLRLILLIFPLITPTNVYSDPAASLPPTSSSVPVNTKSAAYQLSTRLQKKVKAVLTTRVTSPGTEKGLIKFIAFIPPILPTQKVISSSIECVEYPALKPYVVTDDNDSQRSYLCLDLPLSKGVLDGGLTIRQTYVLDMYETKFTDNTKHTDLSILAEKERILNLMPTQALDFKDSAFQEYLDRNGLRKKSNEANIDFAYRAFRVISQELALRTLDNAPGVSDENFKASYICLPSCHNGGCGSCSILLTAAMRANLIPSRLLVGRWAMNTDSSGYEQDHVKCDVWDDGAGWFPVDPSFGMGACKRGGDPTEFFGGDQGGFITFHLNTGLLPHDPQLKQGYIPLQQGLFFHYIGPGPFQPKCTSTWEVQPSRN